MHQEIKIILFQKEHQIGIDAMMDRIAFEFNEPICSPKSVKIAEVYEQSGYHFWVATNHDQVLGTIGLVQLMKGNLVLKSMFLDNAFRGQGISSLLLKKVVGWAIEHHCRDIFLGTMTQFTGAKRFYEKSGFVTCRKTDLPRDFVVNPLDTIFYKRKVY